MSTGTRDPGTAEREFARLVNGAAHRLAAGERPPNFDQPSIWHSPSQPREVASRFGGIQDSLGRTLKFWAQQWWSYTGTHYAVLDDYEILNWIYEALRNAEYRNGNGDLVPWNPDQTKTGKVVHAMRTGRRLLRRTTRPNSWLGDDHGLVIPCRNGLLRVSDRALIAHTADYFGHFVLTFDYDPAAAAPSRWLRFLDEVLPNDPTAQLVMQEWFGYLLSGRTDLHKALMLIGKTRCGKGTIDRLIRALVGDDAHIGLSADVLNDRFGHESLPGKTIATFSDHRVSMNGKQFVETVLQITGNDTMTVRQKGRKDWIGKLGVRLMFLSNLPPNLPDSAGVIVGRMMPIYMPVSYYGREEIGLDDALAAELPGILNWALDGLGRLTAQGHFTKLTSVNNTVMAEEMRGSTNPLFQFIEEYVTVGREWGDPAGPWGLTVGKQEFYDSWKAWAEKNGHVPGSVNSLSRALIGAYGPKVLGKDSTGARKPIYVGLFVHTKVSRFGW